ncbi:MAG: sensor histidine kinase [Alphaproteobacteria bacterium]|nr:sensor histidine kinase [Alphaproteobacteria bacterium]
MAQPVGGETAGPETETTQTRGSIARRMLVTAAVWSVLVLVAAGSSLQALYGAETQQRLDADIDATILTLTSAVDSTANGGLKFNESALPRDERFARVYSGRYWAFVSIDDKNAVVRADRSRSFLETRPDLPPDMIAAAVAQPDAVQRADGTGPDEGRLRIGIRAVKLPERDTPVLLYAAMDRTATDSAVARFALRLGVALGVLALGLVIGVVVLIRYGLRPLHDIQDKLADVRAGRRDRLDGEYPAELSPVVTEINTLITQNRKVVERARTHVGNLAHALKTPLAVLLNESRGADRMSELVRRQTEAMSSNVQHYLKRAQAAAQAEVLGARSDVKDAVEGIARMLERLHREKEITIDVDADETAVFRGERGDLDELVGNLLDNAAKWCRSRVQVKISRSDDGVVVTVDDDGPGLAPEDRARAVERGKRLDESEPGTGLGLSIVRELADIYGARFHLEDSPLGGLRARLELPAAPL